MQTQKLSIISVVISYNNKSLVWFEFNIAISPYGTMLTMHGHIIFKQYIKKKVHVYSLYDVCTFPHCVTCNILQT